MKLFGTLLFSLFAIIIAQAQIVPVPSPDSTRTNEPLIVESERSVEKPQLIDSKAKEYNPRKAGLYSAMMPGLGQIYNRKYWKLPIIYGGFIGLGYGVNFYHQENKKFRRELFDILESGDALSPSGLNETQLRTVVDQSRRERDFFMILTGVLYLLNIADAHIDAHLKEFELNDQLKVSLDPMLNQQENLHAGLSIRLSFQ